MPLPLSSVTIEEKNKLASGSVFLIALNIVIPGLEAPVRVVNDSSNLHWRGATWAAFPFMLEEIGDHAKGETPQVIIRVANVSGVMGAYIRQYDAWTKLNGFAPIEVTICVVNTLAIAVKTVSQVIRTDATATASCTAHRFSTGKEVFVDGADQPDYNGLHAITVSGANAFTYMVTGTPQTPATGSITAQLADPEASYHFELKQPRADRQWATFTLGASNLFIRRFPQAMLLKNHCRFRFKSARCGYVGAQTSCNHTLARCRELANSPRFGGAPGVGNAGFSVE
jgi:hypothetical protein